MPFEAITLHHEIECASGVFEIDVVTDNRRFDDPPIRIGRGDVCQISVPHCALTDLEDFEPNVLMQNIGDLVIEDAPAVLNDPQREELAITLMSWIMHHRRVAFAANEDAWAGEL